MSDFPELEAELRKLTPAKASAELTARIERALDHAAQRSTATGGLLPARRITLNWLSLGAGLAAAAALLLLVRTDLRTQPRKQFLGAMTPAPSVSAAMLPDKYVPSAMTKVVYDKRDEGLVFSGDSAEPARRLRYRTHETMQWQNPNTGASLRVSYPSEEVLLVPISGQ